MQTGAAPSARRGFQVPAEVPRYFAEKRLAPRFSWLDVFGAEHAFAFTVAKAVEVELLETFKESILKAIEQGRGFETWRDQLKPELERLGWWRPRPVADPTGREPATVVDFSSPRRLRTIFWSNMRSARAAGQWERIQRSKKMLPYLLYVRTTALEPREEHLDWAGIILPVDHPFWQTHFPPNGWGCKCAVRQITAREAERLLATGDYRDTPPDGWDETVPFRNKRTGEVSHVPAGIDPGWAGNPGRAAERWRSLAGNLHDKIEATQAVTDGGQLIRPAVAQAVAEVVAGATFARLHAEAAAAWRARTDAARIMKAAGLDQAAQDAAAAAQASWTHVPLPIAVMPVRLDPWRLGRPITVTVTDAAIGHSYGAHPMPPGDWGQIQDILERGEIVFSESENRIWAFQALGSGDRHRMAVLVERGGAWRIMTYYVVKGRYRAAQIIKDGRRSILPELII